jgi:hypothetical protein
MAPAFVTKEQVAEDVRLKKAGQGKAAIAAALGMVPERVAVILSARGLRKPNPEREARDKATVKRWLAAAGTQRRRQAATPRP